MLHYIVFICPFGESWGEITTCIKILNNVKNCSLKDVATSYCSCHLWNMLSRRGTLATLIYLQVTNLRLEHLYVPANRSHLVQFSLWAAKPATHFWVRSVKLFGRSILPLKLLIPNETKKRMIKIVSSYFWFSILQHWIQNSCFNLPHHTHNILLILLQYRF